MPHSLTHSLSFQLGLKHGASKKEGSAMHWREKRDVVQKEKVRKTHRQKSANEFSTIVVHFALDCFFFSFILLYLFCILFFPFFLRVGCLVRSWYVGFQRVSFFLSRCMCKCVFIFNCNCRLQWIHQMVRRIKNGNFYTDSNKIHSKV